LSIAGQKFRLYFKGHFNFSLYLKTFADAGGRAVKGVGLRPLTCQDCGLESRLWHGSLSLVIVMCFEVEASATGR
jgi:hypothetical protein